MEITTGVGNFHNDETGKLKEEPEVVITAGNASEAFQLGLICSHFKTYAFTGGGKDTPFSVRIPQSEFTYYLLHSKWVIF